MFVDVIYCLLPFLCSVFVHILSEMKSVLVAILGSMKHPIIGPLRHVLVTILFLEIY